MSHYLRILRRGLPLLLFGIGVLLALTISGSRAQQLSEPKVKVAERITSMIPTGSWRKRKYIKVRWNCWHSMKRNCSVAGNWPRFCAATRDTEIALTFDDGPHPKFTPQILQVLRAEKVPATFFVVGEMAEQIPRFDQSRGGGWA